MLNNGILYTAITAFVSSNAAIYLVYINLVCQNIILEKVSIQSWRIHQNNIYSFVYFLNSELLRHSVRAYQAYIYTQRTEF